MTVLLTDGSAGLFDVLGRVFQAMSAVQTAARTTIRQELTDILTQFENVTDDIDLNAIIAQVLLADTASTSGASSALSALRTVARNYLVEVVHADHPLTSKTPRAALVELIRQMIEESESVDASTVSITVTADGDNDGDGTVIATVIRGDGLTQQHALAEALTAKAIDDTGRSLTVSDGVKLDLLSVDWPGGSGTQTTVAVTSVGSDVLRDGGFDTVSTLDADVPSGWIVVVGTPGTTISLTTPEQQTVTIAGTPTGGYYQLQYTDRNGKIQTTDPITYDGAASKVQSGLRSLDGLNQLTVSSTGTSPNYTHTVTFKGVGGDVALLVAKNYLSGASGSNEKQSITISNADGGTFTLTFDDTGSNPQTTGNISYPPTSATISTALLALSNVDTGEISVTGSGPWVVEFQNGLGLQNLPAMTIDTASLTRTAPDVVLATVREGGPAANSIQTLELIDTFTGGTAFLRIGNTVTAPFDHDASAADIATAIEDTGDYEVTTSDGPLGTDSVEIEFDGASAGSVIPAMTLDTSGLTGGSISVAVSEQTAGATGGNEIRLLRCDAFGSGTDSVGTGRNFERQKIVRSGTVSGGTFTVAITVSSTTYTSDAIPYDAKWWTILEAIQGVFDEAYGSGTVGVIPQSSSQALLSLTHTSGASSGFEFVLINSGFQNYATITVNAGSLTGGGSYASSGVVNGSATGTWVPLQYTAVFYNGSESEEVDVTSGAESTLQTTMNTLFGSGNCTVTEIAPATYTFEFVGDLAATNIGSEFSMTVLEYLNAVSGEPYMDTVQNGATSSTSEVQRITVAGTPAEGTFRLGRLGSWVSIDFDEAVADTQTKLRTLPGMSAVTVSGAGPFPSNTMDVTFPSTMGNVDMLSVDYSLLLYKVTQTQVGQPDQDEQFTVTLSNSPISGAFTLTINDGTNPAVETGDISYAATSTALKGLLDATALGTFTVTGSAGGPWTVTAGGSLSGINITVTKDAGTLANAQPSGVITTTQQGSDDSGTIAIAESVPGTAQVYSGAYALKLTSNGSELTQITKRLTSLTAATPYAVDCRLILAAASASGVIKFELVDGVNGTVITDDAGNSNAITVNAADLTTSWQALSAISGVVPIFRTPSKLPPLVYFRIRFSTAMPSGKILFVDHLTMVAMTELYAGGPFVAAFGGRDAFRINDEFALAVANNRAGTLHEWMHRTFDLAQERLLLPVNAVGSETVPDTVIQ
jgi:hypothetical protein